MPRKRPPDRDGERWCFRCRSYRPVARFIPLRERPGKARAQLSHDCRDCRAAIKRAIRKARGVVPRGSIEEQRARSVARRAERLAKGRAAWLAAVEAHREKGRYRRSSPVLGCMSCRETMPRDAFHSSELYTCKRCVIERDRVRFQAQKDAITDAYVMRQIRKVHKLQAADVPRSLIEAKRAHIAIKRLLKENS